ncbi:MAG: hypothetical protein IPJ88_14830 [Myxococcales bacterium]|nr:MAG: hypothetical protein IPJ88_14830 [Myxococcales bacterium]
MRALLSLLLLCFISGSASAQGANTPPALTVEPRGGSKTGQLLRAKLSITVADTVTVAMAKSDFGRLEIHSKKHHELRKDNQIQHRFEFMLLSLKPGPVTIPPLTLQLIDQNGEITKVESNSLTLNIASWLANEPNAKLKGASKDDATRPHQVWQDDYLLLWLWLTALALLLLIATVWLIAKKWQSYAQARKPPPPPTPPWELAETKLRTLAKDRAALFEQGKGEEFVDRLSDILREYLGLRYGFEGLECTSDEVIAHLKAIRPEGISIEALILRFSDYDLVKFARADAQEQRAEELIAEVRALINKSRMKVNDETAKEPEHV